MAGHKSDIRYAKESNAMFVHMRDNPGHSFDFEGAKLIYTSNQKPKRQLVESALIATKTNCNLRPGDYPVCRITAPVVLKSVKLADSDKLFTPVPTPSPTTTSTPPTIAATYPTTLSDATGLTQAISTLAISSSTQQLTVIASSQKQLSTTSPAPFSPVANHTRSHYHHPLAISSSTTPRLLQSQARALPPTYSNYLVSSPALTHTDSPKPRITYSPAELSQCFSPQAYTGAIRKRCFGYNVPTSPVAKSPAVKRLRSRNIHY